MRLRNRRNRLGIRQSLCAPLDEIEEGHCRITLRFSEAQAGPPPLPGALWWEGRGQEWTAVCDGRLDALKQAASEINAQVVEKGIPTLEEVFVGRVKAGQPISRED